MRSDPGQESDRENEAVLYIVTLWSFVPKRAIVGPTIMSRYASL